MNPQERIQQGQGVVGVLCAACHAVVITVNAAQFKRDLEDLGAAYYTCRVCAEKEALEQILTANGNGMDLLIPDTSDVPEFARQWAQATRETLTPAVCLREARAWDYEALHGERSGQAALAELARQRASWMREAYVALHTATTV